jgi:toxin FitB
MTFLLDTNIATERAKVEPDGACSAWLEAHRGQCLFSAVTLAEIRYGIERLPEGKRRRALEREYRFLPEDYRGRILPFDQAAASEWGRDAAELEARYGAAWWKQFDLRDTQIAAIARASGLVVATRNEKVFPFVATENPFA